MLNWF